MSSVTKPVLCGPSIGGNTGCLRVAVLSDLHAYDAKPSDGAPSHFCVQDPSNDPTKNPIVGLKELITKNSLTADLLLCPGDIGDKAHPTAIKCAWTAIHETGRCLQAKDIVATSGNHDVDSRYEYNDHDARGILQSLVPLYPFSNEVLNDRYWSRHYVIVANNIYRLLVLNSSAFHGEGRICETKQYEYEHGRVSQHTLGAIKQELDDKATPPVNILLCHHHPHPHSELRLGEHDIMAGGQDLLNLIGTGKYGEWIVIHGHKHHPKMENAAGGASAPVVFAAGSLCAMLCGENQTVTRNQFYILEFPYSIYAREGFVGRFKTWDWAVGHGWLPSTERSGLPAEGGFGWRGNLTGLANQVAATVTGPPQPWTAIRAAIPSVDFLLPRDIDNLRVVLERDHSMKTIPEAGVPREIGRPG